MSKKHKCSMCAARFWTFGGKMRHVAQHARKGSRIVLFTIATRKAVYV